MQNRQKKRTSLCNLRKPKAQTKTRLKIIQNSKVKMQNENVKCKKNLNNFDF
jgi:hypothetical protein